MRAFNNLTCVFLYRRRAWPPNSVAFDPVAHSVGRLQSRILCAPGPSAPRSFESSGQEFVTPETQKAIDRGIVFLANRQHAEGAFGSGSSYKRNVAVTSLAGMTFLSAGHVPGRGIYGKTVDKSIEYILSCVSPSGFIKRDDSLEHGPMYGHGFATLFLAEVYGMNPNKEIREALKSATQLIINSQNKEGGWRYKPDSKDADVSVTVCQMMALRAARNCGIAVPKTTVDNCVQYVTKYQSADGAFPLPVDRKSVDRSAISHDPQPELSCFTTQV